FVRADGNAVGKLGPSTPKQVFDDQRVVTVGGKCEVDHSFIDAGVICHGDFASVGFEQPQVQIARGSLRPGDAADHKSLSGFGGEDEAVDVARLIETT